MLDTIKKLSSRRSTWQVFSDFCEISAITISNSINRSNWNEREKRYLEIIKTYNKAEIDLFADMFGKLIMKLEKNSLSGELDDVLGGLFHELGLHNKWTGQFFTPMNICNAMSEMTVGNCDEVIKKKGYITVGEPSVGSGAMVLGIANALDKKGYNHQKHMRVTATDIDIKCVHMAYIQFALHGIPAIVVHGNSLILEEWDKWYTPTYVWGKMGNYIQGTAISEKSCSTST